MIKHNKNHTELKKNIIKLIDNRHYQDALDLIHQQLYKNIDVSKQEGAFLKADLAGFLIDIGCEGNIENALIKGIEIFENDKSAFLEFITEYGIEYNLGNAIDGLFRIRRSNCNFTFKPKTIELLTEAKDHYLKAYKLMPSENSDFRARLLINLANALDTLGRVSEAITYYDLVLEKYPNHPKANANRANALWWLHKLSGSFSINQIWQAMKGYKIASDSESEPYWLRKQWIQKSEGLQNFLDEQNYIQEKVEHDIVQTQGEADGHSEYRK